MIPSGFPRLKTFLECQLAIFPEHEPFFQKRFYGIDEAELAFAEKIAGTVMQIAGGNLDRICHDYRWLSQVVLDEELHFRRNGRYRLSTFEQAYKEVYSNPEFMARYTNGLLATQLWWCNHTEMLRFFHDEFIEYNPSGFTHLEIGPGHGLLLGLAAVSPRCASAEAWDVSDSSLFNTQQALTAMGIDRAVSLKKVNMFHAPEGRFSSIAFSEVLEHLERPLDALNILHGLLADDGRVFLNAPVNSPAPDHLYLFDTPEQVLDMIVRAGFSIDKIRLAPCTGATLEWARRRKLTISVGAIIRKA
jgi:2-polyprenyl-3-methyl-5-hydroxy-6-metoxy-1,4-benzoquinol methylase